MKREDDGHRGGKRAYNSFLPQYLVRAHGNGIDPSAKLLRGLSADTQDGEYVTQRYYSYVKRYMDSALDESGLPEAAFLQFDQNGCLQHIYATQSHLEALATEGIRPDTLWSAEQMGPNAVSVGLAEHRLMFSVGEENFNKSLQGYAIYFAPISMQRLYPPFPYSHFGGIAAIVPADEHNPDYLLLVWGIARDLVLNMHFSQTANMLYERTGQGVLSVDPFMNSGYVTTTYCNRSLFDMLEVEPFDLYYKPLDSLIDPPPHNQEFWSIIHELRKVENLNLTLTVRGRKIFCIVSTDTYEQATLNVRGVIFFITTMRQISQDVSAKMGNSAIFSFNNIIGQSPVLRTAIQRGRQVAQMTSNVMLLGESGVGKDLFAQAIHNGSQRNGKPFIAVNCGALPRDLIASELFGYVQGAFTGAKREGNIGKFELANGGTIFLDEIGELPLDLQATLLRIVEEKRFMRLGGNRVIDIDVKIISATNADIPSLIAKKLFRADLYYRLSTVRITIPPLRERGQDIILLADYFIAMVATKIGKGEDMVLAESTKELLMQLPWRGNVRELQNLFECIVQLYTGRVILPEHVQSNLQLPEGETKPPELPFRPQSKSARAPIRHVELTAEDFQMAMEVCGNNKTAAARHLNISLRTLYRKLGKLGL